MLDQLKNIGKQLQDIFASLKKFFAQAKSTWPKFDFKPRRETTVTLFANSAEALVFWASLFALVLWTIASTFRFFTTKTAPPPVEIQQYQSELESRMQVLESQNQRNSALIDSLNTALQQSQERIRQLESRND